MLKASNRTRLKIEKLDNKKEVDLFIGMNMNKSRNCIMLTMNQHGILTGSEIGVSYPSPITIPVIIFSQQIISSNPSR